ncbi:hypothetical protein CASFOL_030007 [Castilleja foliolosa]|uniref:F-box domain-containing protein n=1 Tax=Castilleja foliolosa TaxID=1961234 RepID=A0ABD3C9E9_9LAMI
MSRSQATQSAAASALQVKIKPPPVLRKPRPHHRHRAADSTMDGLTDSQLQTFPTTKKTDEEEKENSEIDVPTKRAKVKNGQSQNRSDFLNTNINSLPNELVFDILAQLPAQDIYAAVMTVCFKWYKIIHTHTFVNTHLHRSTYGLLVQNRVSETTQLTFMALSRQGRVELTWLNYEPKYEIWCNSCNGLILEWDCENQCEFYITNPATMQQFYLPPFPHPTCFIYSALVYASLSMDYKVIIVFRREKEWRCAILTVSVDESWRLVRTQHLSLESKKLLIYNPLTTEGFVHWANMGWSWEIWEMKPETGEWTKLSGIKGNDLKDRRGEIISWLGKCDSSVVLLPVGWLEYREVLVFDVMSLSLSLDHRFCIAWNVRSKEIQFIKLDSNSDVFLVHTNSLMDSQDTYYPTFGDEFEVEPIPSSFQFDESQSNHGKKKVHRKQNFSIGEDLVLVSAWLNGQKEEWQRQYYSTRESAATIWGSGFTASAVQVKFKPPPVLRQPPPPYRGSLTMDGLTDSKVNTIPTTKKTDEEEEEKGNSEIVPTNRAKVKYGQSRSRPYYPRRCKRSDFLTTNINSLPDELVFEILVHLPAHDIYNAIMTVSRKWYQIIHTQSFVNTHLHRSNYGLLVQNQFSQPTQLLLCF